jgi:ubiquitin-like domain-containing CTD phosphatase 1
VLPKRQKLIGLKDKSGKLASDNAELKNLKLKPGMTVMMLGAQEEVIDSASAQHAEGEVALIDDLQMNEELFEEVEPHKDPIVLVRPFIFRQICCTTCCGLLQMDFNACKVSCFQTQNLFTHEVQEKLERRIQRVEVKVLMEPRPGKKLLVIDIDYTIFDLGSSAEQPMELAR